MDSLFDVVKIPQAVWNEITYDPNKADFQLIHSFFKDKVQKITSFNELVFLMDLGESESVKLYKEMQADFLLIDDRKARNIAEALGIKCIGIIGLLAVAKDRGLINALRPLFETFLLNKRFL